VANILELGQITEEIINGWAEKYEKRAKYHYCKKCGSRIKQTTCYVSIHFKEFKECAGPGRVVHINYPYCPKCDGKIDYAQACYHVEAFRRTVIVVDTVPILLNPGKGD